MQHVETANQEAAEQHVRADSLFGVCKLIGEDLGFNPFYLRLALLGLAVVSIGASVAAYAALGIAVGLSRIFFPAGRNDGEAVETAPVSEEQSQQVERSREPVLVAA